MNQTLRAEPGDDSQEAKSSPAMLETAEPRLVDTPSADPSLEHGH